MSEGDCPLGLCDGYGFRHLPIGAPDDGREVEDEDNCPHTEHPQVEWTPERVGWFLSHYRSAHVFGDPRCRWCVYERTL